jgi:sterol desaturase/sphingolipid hydroxylase (fatty acid hydroxylase superfamily)
MSASLKITPESFGRNIGRWLDIVRNNFIFSYWIGFFTDPLTVAFLLFWDVAILGSNIYLLAACFLAGLLGWTLMEYCFHRWIYHQGKTLLHAGHSMHHEDPKMLIGMPWFLTTTFLLGLWYVFTYWLEVRYVSGFVAGLLGGFVFYYCFHHIHHHFNPKNSWYRKLRAHHKIHHQMPETNFGVTMRFWDRVFRTTYKKPEEGAKKKPRVATSYK